MPSRFVKAPIRRLIDTPHRKGRPAEPSSIDDEARDVGRYLDRGLQRYDLRLSELWPPPPFLAEILERRKAPDDGFGWVRLQFSRLRRGFYLDSRGVRRGISYAVQRDLYRLIANHPKTHAWFAAHLQNSGFKGDVWILEGPEKYPAMRRDLLQPEITAIIDPESIPLFAKALADALCADNVITERRDEARSSIETYLKLNGREITSRAALNLYLKCKNEINDAITNSLQPESIGITMVSNIALKLWPETNAKT